MKFRKFIRAQKSHFQLLDDAGAILLESQAYESKEARDNGIDSVKTNINNANRYERLSDGGKEYYILKAANGQEIARSIGYTDQGALTKALSTTQAYSVAQPDGGEAYGTDGRSDDYKPLGFYEKNGSGTAEGFDSFDAEGESYFSYNLDGLVYMISEGYKSAASRDNGIGSVERNMTNEDRYQTQQHPNGKYYFNLKAGNNQEIATSRWFNSAGEMNSIIARLTGKGGGAAIPDGANLIAANRVASVNIDAPPPPAAPKEKKKRKKRTTPKKPKAEKVYLSNGNYYFNDVTYQMFRSGNGKHYFTFKNADDKTILLNSDVRGFETPEQAEAKIKEVLKYGPTESNYEGKMTTNGKYYFYLKDADGKNIAKSFFFGKAEDMQATIGSLLGTVVVADAVEGDETGEAVAASANNKSIDEYLPCDVYQSHIADKSPEHSDFIVFSHEGEYYFAWIDEEKIVMRSEGYTTEKARDNGIASVIKNRELEERFDVKEDDGKYFTILKAGNHQEIARSCPKADKAAALYWFPSQVGERKQAFLAAAALASQQKADEEAKLAAEQAARLKAEQEAARIKAEEEARIRAEQEAARKKAEEEAARVKAAEEEKMRLAAEEEARLKAQQEAARKKAEEEAARLKAEEEKARLAAEQEAKLRAEEEAARKKAEEEKARLAAEKEAKLKAEQEAARKKDEEKKAAAAAAATAAAALVAAKAAKRDDDYLLCKFYKGHPRSTQYKDFSLFKEDGEFYFAMLDKDDKVVLRSEGYKSEKGRENGIQSVLKNRDIEGRYSTIEKHGAHFVVLKAGNNQEIGRSCPYKEKAAALGFLKPAAGLAAMAAAAPLVVPKSTPKVEPKAKVTPPKKVVKTEKKKVVATEKKKAVAAASKKVAAAPIATTTASSGGGFKWWWLLPLLLLIPLLWFGLKGCGGEKAAAVVAPKPAVVETPVVKPEPVVAEPVKVETPKPEPVKATPPPVVAQGCDCGAKNISIFDIPKNVAAKNITKLGTFPEFGNSHDLSPAEFFQKLSDRYNSNADDRAYLDYVYRSMGYRNGFAGARANQFSNVELARGTKGLLGFGEFHGYAYSQLNTSDYDRRAFKLKSNNGCDVHFMKTCGNYMFFCE